MDDDKLAIEEARRAGQHGSVKAQAEGEVQAEIAEHAARVARISQIVDYIFYVIYALLGMRFLLALLAARSSAGFVRFIVAVTNPFYRPFQGIVASPSTDSGHTLMLPLIIAIIVYLLLHLGINGLLRIIAHRKTAV